MELLVLRASEEGTAARARSAVPAGTVWAQFGDETIVAGDGAAWKRLVSPIAGTALRAERHASVTPDRLHVVVQTGRSFQQDQPDVPVLHDRGRFLLVDLAPEHARRLRRRHPRRHPTCYRVFPLGSGEVVFSRARSSARAADPKVKRLVDRISSERIRADLTSLAGMHTRLSTSRDYRTAIEYVSSALGRLGYGVRRQRVPMAGGGSQNVIADRKGNATGSRALVIVGAHLDSVNWEDGAAAPAPGADDNASGSAGVLEIARIFANVACRDDLRFILFGGEEQGLHGSKHHVEKMTAAERRRVRAVVNMDMIASTNTSQRTVLLEGAALSTSVIDELQAAAGTYTGLDVERSLHASNSDHVPFIERGVPAVLTIEGADSTNHRVHSALDTLEHLDEKLALEILRMNVAFVAGTVGIV